MKAKKEQRANKRALKAAQGKSLAPRGYKPDTETRTKIQKKVDGSLNDPGTTFYEGTPGAPDYKVLDKKSIRKSEFDAAANIQDWKENPGSTVAKMEVDMITGRKAK